MNINTDVAMTDIDQMDSEMAITPVTSNPNFDHKQPPHLNLNLNPRDRNDSLISIDTAYTTYTVRTNADQTFLPPNIHNPHLNFTRRQNSSTSITSSIFSEVPPPQLENYSFTSNFDDELYSYYIAYSQQPNITPFDIRFPPSGILSLISKLFVENYLIESSTNEKIQIDTRPEINNDLLLDSNRHKLLAVIRLRLIQLCNINLVSNDDQFNFNDQLPISRTNSIASAISIGDRVLPSMSGVNTDFNFHPQSTTQQVQSQIQPQIVHRPSWLHMPNHLYSAAAGSAAGSKDLNIPFSTDSTDRIDNVPLIFNDQQLEQHEAGNLNSSESTLNTTNNITTTTTTTTSATKKERPSLDLRMPSFLKYRSNQQFPSNNHAHPPRPLFSTGPATPGTPNTPNTPIGPNSNHSQRAQRERTGSRSGSLSQQSTTNYFSLTPVISSNGHGHGHNHNHHHSHNQQQQPQQQPSTPVTSKPLMNPTLTHLQPPHANYGSSASSSSMDLSSPFEQSFPSPLGFNPTPPNHFTHQHQNQHQSPTNQESSPLSATTPTTPATSELYNATVARKRDSLKLKRGLN